MDTPLRTLAGVANTVLETTVAAGEAISNGADAFNRWFEAPIPVRGYESDSSDGYEFITDSEDEDMVAIHSTGVAGGHYDARKDDIYGNRRYRPPGQMEQFFHTGRLLAEGLREARSIQREHGVMAGVQAVQETLKRLARDPDLLERLQVGRHIVLRNWENAEEFLDFVVRKAVKRHQRETRKALGMQEHTDSRTSSQCPERREPLDAEHDKSPEQKKSPSFEVDKGFVDSLRLQ